MRPRAHQRDAWRRRMRTTKETSAATTKGTSGPGRPPPPAPCGLPVVALEDVELLAEDEFPVGSETDVDNPVEFVGLPVPDAEVDVGHLAGLLEGDVEEGAGVNGRDGRRPELVVEVVGRVELEEVVGQELGDGLLGELVVGWEDVVVCAVTPPRARPRANASVRHKTLVTRGARAEDGVRLMRFNRRPGRELHRRNRF